MKFLYHFRTQGTGAEAVHISGMASALESFGYSVRFSSPSGRDPRQTAGATPFRPSRLGKWAQALPRFLFEFLELGYNAAAFLRICRLLQTETFAFVYERHAFFLFATALLASRHRIPLVVEVNELPGDERVREQPRLMGLAQRLDRFVFRRAALIVVVSPHLKRRLEEMEIPGGKVLVLPNAVSQRELDRKSDGGSVRQKHNLHGQLVIGFVGWFVAWHKLDRLVRVVADLSEDFPHLRLMLVGDGPEGPQLRKLAEELGVLHRLIFTGTVSHEQVPDHIAAFDIAVVPHSNQYRSPIKLFEYMAAERAIVAPATEPISAVVRNGKTALLFPPASETGLEASLRQLLASDPLRQRLGTAAREVVRRRHTWEHNAEQVLAELGMETRTPS